MPKQTGIQILRNVTSIDHADFSSSIKPSLIAFSAIASLRNSLRLGNALITASNSGGSFTLTGPCLFVVFNPLPLKRCFGFLFIYIERIRVVYGIILTGKKSCADRLPCCSLPNLYMEI